MTLDNKWLHHFMKEAFLASEMSKDSTKVGSVIVGEDKEVLSKGFNGFPKGVNELDIRNLPEYKQYFTCHAEQNAIDLAKAPLKGAILFCTHEPCAVCVRSIIQKGIKEVYFCHKMEKEHWKTSVIAGKLMLQEAKIKTHRVNYTPECSFVVVEPSTKEKLSSTTSILSECHLPTIVQSSMDTQKVQIYWGELGPWKEVLESKTSQRNGMTLKVPMRQLNTEEMELVTTRTRDLKETKK